MGSGSSTPRPPLAKEGAEQSAAAQPTIPERVENTIATALGEVPATDEGIYDGFLVETNVTFDLSVPTNAVEGAIAVVNVIITLLVAYRNRNQFLRALQNRVESLDAAVRSLQQRDASVLAASVAPLKTLVSILVDLKAFVRHVIAEPEGGLFAKVVSFFRSKSDLENLASFDTLITRALADLNVPLQADQLRLMETQRQSLTQLSADITRVLAKLDETKVLSIAKRCLSFEDALTFWMECYPDKFQVTVRDFVPTLKVWLEESRGMQLTKRAVENMVAAVNLGELIGEEGGGGAQGLQDLDKDPSMKKVADGVFEDRPDEFVDAREVNLLFQSLPENYASMPIPAILDVVVERVQKVRRDAAKKLQEARKSTASRTKQIVGCLSGAETELIRTFPENFFWVRFLMEATVVVGGASQSAPLPTPGFLYIGEDGSWNILKQDASKEGGHSLWKGALYDDLSCVLNIPVPIPAISKNMAPAAASQSQLPPNATEIETSANGVFRGNMFVVPCLEPTCVKVHSFRLPSLCRWEGYYAFLPPSEPNPDNMNLMLGDTGGVVHGISDDAVGVAIWRGFITEKEFHVTKKYLRQHFVNYDGNVSYKADGLRHISGTWSIPGDWSGSFELWELSNNVE